MDFEVEDEEYEEEEKPKKSKKKNKQSDIMLYLAIFFFVLALVLIIVYASSSKKTPQVPASEPTEVTPIDPTPSDPIEPDTITVVDEDSNERPLAVMIDTNIGDAKHAGLQDSFVNYEIIVEGGLTRIMAIFKDKEVGIIGPVRSARNYFIDYALEYDAVTFRQICLINQCHR